MSDDASHPTSEAPPVAPDPRAPLESDHTSLLEALDVLAHPAVQAVLRDDALMVPVLAKDPAALRTEVLRTSTLQTLLSDADLVQRIAALGVEEEVVGDDRSRP